MALSSFFLGKAITFVPKILLGIVLVLAVFFRYFSRSEKKLGIRPFILAAISIRVLYAIFQTVAQYIIWRGSDFTKLLLSLPVEPGGISLRLFPFAGSSGGYFIFYSFMHFWLGILISIFMAWVFYRFLKLLERHNGRYFEEGETEIGFLAALIAGWPGFVSFLALVFASVVIISLIKMLFFKQKYTTLGPAFILAAALILPLEPYITRLFGLGVLRI